MAERGIVVIGLGNEYRTDDGVGVAAAEVLGGLALPRVRVVTGIADPMGLLEAWSGAGLAVVFDAAVATPPVPGRVRRCALAELGAGDGLSSHGVDVVRAHALGQALGRVPDKVVVLTVDVADVGHGVGHGRGLTPRVAAAVPEVVDQALSEIGAEIRDQGLINRDPTASRSRRPASR